MEEALEADDLSRGRVIPRWRYHLFLLLVLPVTYQGYHVLYESLWRFAFIGVAAIAYALLFEQYKRRSIS